MDKDYNVRLDRIPLALSRLNEAIDELLELCDDLDAEVRYNTIELFMDIKTEKTEEAICRLLHDSNELVRTTCLEVLGSWKDSGKEQSVLQMLNDSSWLVRSAAIIAIGDMGILSAVKTLENPLPVSDDEEKVRIYYALYKLGKYDYLSLFLDGLFHDFYRVRCATANLSVDLVDERNKSFILNTLLQRLQTEETVAARSSMQGAIEDLREMMPK